MSDTHKPTLSICIPTYNRSHLVYECVTEILKYDSPQIEVVVSNNASTDNTEKLLMTINDERFRYRCNAENNMYLNIIDVMEYATGDWLLLMSDEDRFNNIHLLDDVLEEIEAVKDVSAVIYKVMRTDGKEARHWYTNQKTGQAEEAFDEIWRLWFMPGILLNRKLVDFHEVWNLIYKLKKNNLTVLYPHMCVLFMAIHKGDIICKNISLLSELPNRGFQQKWNCTTKEMLNFSLYVNGMLKIEAETKFAILLKIIINYFYLNTWHFLDKEDYQSDNFLIFKNMLFNLLGYKVLYRRVVKRMLGKYVASCINNDILKKFRRDKKEYIKICFLSMVSHDKWLNTFYHENEQKLLLR